MNQLPLCLDALCARKITEKKLLGWSTFERDGFTTYFDKIFRIDGLTITFGFIWNGRRSK